MKIFILFTLVITIIYISTNFIFNSRSNISNVSEVSLKLLFNCADNLAKRTAFQLLRGMYKRLEYIGRLAKENFSDIDIAFNYNRPIDNSSLIKDIEIQMDLGIMSKETAMRVSPYIEDIDKELNNLERNGESVENSGVERLVDKDVYLYTINYFVFIKKNKYSFTRLPN